LVSRGDGTPIDDADLFTLAHGRGSRSLWERLRESGDPRFTSARVFLERWLLESGGLGPFTFFSRLLVDSRAALLRRLGLEANDPLDALLDTALDFERDHAPTLSAFLAWFAGADIEIKRDMDQGGDEVRVMTVHGAKGLESHIVILPDTVDMPDNRRRAPVILVKPDPSGPEIPFWVLSKTPRSLTVQSWCDAKLDSAGDEYRRLLYVAMTRARDELYVCGWYNRSEPKPDCWYELIKAGLIEHAGEVPEPDGGMCMRMGMADVWTDTTPPEQRSDDALPPQWLTQARAEPTQPVTRFSERIGGPVSSRRETRIARGRLLHKLLQRLPDIPEEARAATAALLAKREGFTEEIAKSAVALIADPRHACFFAGNGLAEVPIAMKGPDGKLVSGQIDRLIVTDEEVLILDYKTDARPPENPETVDPSYLHQLAGYRAAIRLVFPDKKVRAALLWTEIPNLMEVADDFLDKAAMQKA
jgi:ATP-dependent helicase/nuclease subunit A